MNKDCIIINIRPFVFKQQIAVYQDGNCIRTIKCKLDDIENTVRTLSDIYNINKINLVEKSDTYSLKIRDSLLSKYADKNFEITMW